MPRMLVDLFQGIREIPLRLGSDNEFVERQILIFDWRDYGLKPP